VRSICRRYVSDHGFNGYKSYCQQKLLQGPDWAAVIPRKYPPSLLEWNASAKRLPMAMQVEFADGWYLFASLNTLTELHSARWPRKVSYLPTCHRLNAINDSRLLSPDLIAEEALKLYKFLLNILCVTEFATSSVLCLKLQYG